jgi:hypothetical protein
VLAAAAPRRTATVVGAVDALRGEWFVQAFRSGPAPSPLGPARRIGLDELPGFGPCQVAGYGVGRALAALASCPHEAVAFEPGPLAPVALRLARIDPPAWDAAELARPLYLRAPAVTLPRDAVPG